MISNNEANFQKFAEHIMEFFELFPEELSDNELRIIQELFDSITDNDDGLYDGDF